METGRVCFRRSTKQTLTTDYTLYFEFIVHHLHFHRPGQVCVQRFVISALSGIVFIVEYTYFDMNSANSMNGIMRTL